MTLLKTPSRFATLSIARRHDVGFAGPRELEIMRLLSPHLRRAVSIADLIEMRELTVKTFESSFDSLLVPVVFADGGSRIVHANGAARKRFAAGDPIWSDRGILKARTPDARHPQSHCRRRHLPSSQLCQPCRVEHAVRE